MLSAQRSCVTIIGFYHFVVICVSRFRPVNVMGRTCNLDLLSNLRWYTTQVLYLRMRNARAKGFPQFINVFCSASNLVGGAFDLFVRCRRHSGSFHRLICAERIRNGFKDVIPLCWPFCGHNHSFEIFLYKTLQDRFSDSRLVGVIDGLNLVRTQLRWLFRFWFCLLTLRRDVLWFRGRNRRIAYVPAFRGLQAYVVSLNRRGCVGRCLSWGFFLRLQIFGNLQLMSSPE